MTDAELKDTVERFLGRRPERVLVHTDTTNFYRIDRGDVLALGGRHYLITGTAAEYGFGLDGEPKFWVKTAVECATGARKIIKLVFLEQFNMTVGGNSVVCFRSPAKEARVLEAVGGHPHFMQGMCVQDERGNEVRVIDFIAGLNLEQHLGVLPAKHEEYFHVAVPDLLRALLPCIMGLAYLHARGERHGDVRPDHLIVDDSAGLLRWIDFDYDFDYREAPFGLDVLGVGNVISATIGRGFVDAHRIGRERALAGLADRLVPEDLSLINRGRLMNLRKAYPYVPDRLNRLLMHFSAGAELFYDSVLDIADDLGDALAILGNENAGDGI